VNPKRIRGPSGELLKTSESYVRAAFTLTSGVAVCRGANALHPLRTPRSGGGFGTERRIGGVLDADSMAEHREVERAEERGVPRHAERESDAQQLDASLAAEDPQHAEPRRMERDHRRIAVGPDLGGAQLEEVFGAGDATLEPGMTSDVRRRPVVRYSVESMR